MRQLIRYGIVGLLNNAAIYLIFLLVTYWGVTPKIAMSFLYVVAAVASFIWNKNWTFSYSGRVNRSFTRFVLAHIGGYLINLLILLVFVDRLGYSHQAVQAVAIFVVAGFLFIAFKYFVFNQKKRIKVTDVNPGFKPHYFKQLACLEAGNFWFRGRNDLILWALHKYCPKLQSFLEVGCGTGFVMSAIANKYPSAELIGGEYLEEGLVYARQRQPNVNFIQLDARCIPYQEQFDAIGAFDVIEHIVEDELVLHQIFKALKLGGVLFITVPQHQWLWSSVDEHACHVRRYSANELHEKISRAGFDIVRSTSFVSILLPVMYVSRLLRRGGGSTVIEENGEFQIHPILNRIFEFCLSIDLSLIRRGVDLPVGGSRLLVASKGADGS
jgi:putative flippase GtrA/SAM-dependent methyltransferase